MSGQDLFKACQNGNTGEVKRLIAAGADLNWADGNGCTGVWQAGYHGHTECVLLMAQARADLNRAGSSGYHGWTLWTPAHAGAQCGSLGCLEVLFMFGADLTKKNSNGQTPSDVASGDCKAFLDTVLSDPYYQACVNNNAAALRDLCANRGIPTTFTCGHTLLHMAAAFGSVACMDVLFSTTDVQIDAENEHGYTALHIAAARGQQHAAMLLLDSGGADLNVTTTTGYTACEIPKGPLHGKLRDVASAPPVFDLCRRHAMADLRALLQSDPPAADAKDAAGRTPLHVMCSRPGFRLPDEVVYTLLDSGASANAPATNGMTPLHMAVKYRRMPDSVMRLLMDYGADVNAQDQEGNTPLHYAVWEGRLEAAEMLIKEGGCDATIRNQNGTRAPYYVNAHPGAGRAVREIIDIKRRAAPLIEAMERKRKRVEEKDELVGEFEEEFEEAISIKDKEAVMIRTEFAMKLARYAQESLARTEQQLAMVLRGDLDQ